jgi:hypothetical protein
MGLNTESINTSTIMERYGIKSRTTLNDWLSLAGIQSFKEGKETFIHSFQLDALDAIAREKGWKINYSAGAKIEDYEPVLHEPKIDQPQIAVSEEVDLLAIAREFESLPTLARWYTAHLILERLVAKKVVLPKEIVLLLLNKRRLPRCVDGFFAWGNFGFHRISSNWLVTKER